MAPYDGTLVPRPIRQSGSSPSPPIGSKNPYSYRYRYPGKNLKDKRDTYGHRLLLAKMEIIDLWVEPLKV